MIRARVFHANSLDKMAKVQEQFNQFLAKLDDDAIISVSTTEFGPSSNLDFYSYTILLVFRDGHVQQPDIS